MKTEKNFKFDLEKSEPTVRVTEIKGSKVHASFDAFGKAGRTENRQFVYNLKTHKIRNEDGRVTSKDEVLNQAAKYLESLGETGRKNILLKTELGQKSVELDDAEREITAKNSELGDVKKSNRYLTAVTAISAGLGLISGIAAIGMYDGNVDKERRIDTLEDTIDTQHDTINTKNTMIGNLTGDLGEKNATISDLTGDLGEKNATISDLAGDLGEKNATIKWHQDAWDLDNKTITSSGLYGAGWNDSIEARKNITRTYITDNFNDNEISAVTTENLSDLTLDQLFDVALKLEYNEGDSDGYQRAVAIVGDVLAAEGLQESDYASAGLIERLVLYGEHVVAENKTAFFDDGYDEGYAIALQEAVSIADDIMGKAKAGQYDKVDALVKAYGEAVAAESLQLADYNDKYVLDAVNVESNWSKADQALDRLANLRGGAPSIQPDNATRYQAFMTNVTDSEKNELDKTALSFGYSSFTDMWNQDFGFYAVDTFGPGAVIVAYDSDTRMVGKLSDSLYQKIKSQGE